MLWIALAGQNRAVIRGSDDFYPREDSSHGPHLYANAYNSLLLSSLGVQDWDMFQTGLGNKARKIPYCNRVSTMPNNRILSGEQYDEPPRFSVRSYLAISASLTLAVLCGYLMGLRDEQPSFMNASSRS